MIDIRKTEIKLDDMTK